ncbi:MAG: hypothetical protein ACI87H_002578 [Gammaproteobacteria bacterium]|jgi:hypothetical protein
MCLYVLVIQPGLAAETSPSSQQEYLGSLIELGKQNQLAQQRSWQLLLHYRPDRFGAGVTSEIDGDEFFLAPTGKTDPEAELETTLATFFSNRKTGPAGQLPQCAFPARYFWLNTELHFDPALMPVQRCESIDLWRERINANSVSLIFSSYFLNNPASMFGHTLLRFNSVDAAQPGLLDYAVNYAAVIDPGSGFVDYAWKGISGGFEGRFSVSPYYDMVKQYNDLENRDLWEYRLNFSSAQIDFMLLHIWELLFTHSDFYFLRENCSYQLLSVLEVGDPELHLRDQYWAWTLPTDTIKQINDQPGLVTDVVRRASLGSQLDYRLSELNDLERSYVKQLSDDPAKADTTEFSLMKPERRARLIDAAIEFIQYQSYQERKLDDGKNNNMHALLVQRSQLAADNAKVPQPDTAPVSPDQGHDPVRFGISGGYYHSDEDSAEIDNESFLELSIQPGFHDLLSAEAGQAPNSQINFLNLRTRYEAKSESWRLQNFTLIDIISLYPVTSLVQEPSWKINLGWEANRDNSCLDCTPFILNPGIGLAFQSNLHRREVYFALLEVNLELGHEFESDHRAGIGIMKNLN